MANPMVNQLQNLTSRWKSLVSIAVFILTVVGSFLIPPPTGDSSLQATMLPLAKFLVTVISGIMVLMTGVFSKNEHWKLWTVTTCVAFISAWFLLLHYQSASDICTCGYANTTVFIGTKLSKHGFVYMKSSQDEVPCGKALMDYAGTASDIWSISSIRGSGTSCVMLLGLCKYLFFLGCNATGRVES